MISFESGHCTGCRACEQVCPKNCISMVPDKDGFIYPAIDREKCIQCNLCETHCPNNMQRKHPVFEQKVYAAVLKNGQTLLSSSSGGAFSAIAEYVIESGGVIFGCAFNDKLEAVHIGIQNPQELSRLRGSKYVQSDTQDTFRETRKLLNDGRLVLYTGTPCQIAGLTAFLEKPYHNLITVDLVCHGAPSPVLFKGYLEWLSKKLRGDITGYAFREKSKNGWSLTAGVTYMRGGKPKHKLLPGLSDPYYSLFLKGHTYRSSCYECRYANLKRTGDFTIGDFWGVEKYHPELDTSRGVSLIIVNSEKASDIINKISGRLLLIESTAECACEQNKQLVYPTERSKLQKEIYSTFRDGGFEAVAKNFPMLSTRKKYAARVKLFIPKSARVFIKKLFKTANPRS